MSPHEQGLEIQPALGATERLTGFFKDAKAYIAIAGVGITALAAPGLAEAQKPFEPNTPYEPSVTEEECTEDATQILDGKDRFVAPFTAQTRINSQERTAKIRITDVPDLQGCKKDGIYTARIQSKAKGSKRYHNLSRPLTFTDAPVENKSTYRISTSAKTGNKYRGLLTARYGDTKKVYTPYIGKAPKFPAREYNLLEKWEQE